MAVKHVFLALLAKQPMHGYELKNAFEEIAAGSWPLNFGQFYQTLNRLERDGFIESFEVVQEDKPDKKVYQITEDGRDHLKEWLQQDDHWNLFFDEQALRLMALPLVDSALSGEILKGYRNFILRVIAGLTKMLEEEKDTTSTYYALLERNILRAEADLTWINRMIERWERHA